MRKKDKKKRVIVSQKLYPNQINELALCCFIIKKDKLDDLHEFVVNNGGRVISAIAGKGLSRNSIFDVFLSDSTEVYMVLCVCQQEIADIFMLNAAREFEFNKKGRGKAFLIDVLGYMGAKGVFVE